MAYLDEDILYNNVEEKYKVAKGKARNAYSDVLDTICEMPRADVVPKSEVERLNLEYAGFKVGAKQIIEALNTQIASAKTEAAREIIGDIRKVNNLFSTAIGSAAIARILDELKKKYTEQSCNDCASQDDCEKATHIENYQINGCMDFKDKVCTDCKHFIGCECFDGKTCDSYEREVTSND